MQKIFKAVCYVTSIVVTGCSFDGIVVVVYSLPSIDKSAVAKLRKKEKEIAYTRSITFLNFYYKLLCLNFYTPLKHLPTY